jgi:mRNA-degrading endonuclease RelE of RelBE toxin-antitoxin system
LDIRPKLYKQLEKLEKTNIVLFDAIFKKVDEILENPERCENLRAPLNHLKGVHIQKSFVLLFSVDKETKTVILEKFDAIQIIIGGIAIDNINKNGTFFEL